MGNKIANRCRPPMKIHQIHGKNLRIPNDRLMAKRFEGYADAMFFGSRTVDRDEQIELIITEMTINWNGSLRFGFTSHDPVNILKHPEGIPRFMCPDLVKRGGSFIETLNHIKLRVGDRIVFWVNVGGEVQMKVNDVQQRPQTTKLVTSEVWPVVDVYGNAVEVKFRSLKDKVQTTTNQIVEAHIYTSLSLAKFPVAGNNDSLDLSNRDCVRRKTLNKAYAWNANPLPINTVWVVLVKEVDYQTSKNLCLAVLTSAPLGSIAALPEAMEGFQRSTILNNVYERMIAGDELAICITDSGTVLVALNGDAFDTFGTVPKSATYWIVANMNCDIASLASVGVYQMTKFPLPKLPQITENFASRQLSPSIGAMAESFASMTVVSEPTVREIVSTPVMAPNKDAECVICLNSIPDSVFIPCGHICCCKPCADNLMNEHGNLICPTCRKVIENNIKVYFG